MRVDLLEPVGGDDAAADAGLVGADRDTDAVAVEARDRRCGAGDEHELARAFDEIGAILVEHAIAVEQNELHQTMLRSARITVHHAVTVATATVATAQGGEQEEVDRP